MAQIKDKEWPQDWIDMFNESDINNDGELCRDEIVYCMQVLGTNPTDEEVNKYIKESDKNDDDKFNLDEFCDFMEKQLELGSPEEQLRRAFDHYDKDKNGLIDKHELKRILEDCQEDADDEELIDELIKSADTNKDGMIDLDEFSKRLQQCD